MRWYAIIFLLISFLIASCKSEKAAEQITAEKENVVAVKTVSVSKTLINQKYKLTGEAAAFKEVDIMPKINAVVQTKNAELGDMVKKGQVLATVKQDIPGLEFSVYNIESTIEGVITMDALEIGSTVSPQRSVYRISQQNPVYVNINVPENLIAKVKIGEKLTIQFDAFPDKDYTGKIVETSPVLNPVSRALQVRIKIDNPGYKIKPGMFGIAWLYTDQKEGLIIPVDALIRSGAKRYVYKIKNNTAEKIPVETGMITDSMIEVKSGVDKGDQIVVFGQNLLDDGTKVEVKD
jgi:membrane fusion protein (multidrug efflux system)